MFPRIEAMGAGVVAVVCQRPGRVESWLANNPFPFPIVVDEERRIVKDWGVHHLLGIDAFNIARPSSFVVDGSGTVRFAFVAPSQSRLAKMDAVLGALTEASR